MSCSCGIKLVAQFKSIGQCSSCSRRNGTYQPKFTNRDGTRDKRHGTDGRSDKPWLSESKPNFLDSPAARGGYREREKEREQEQDQARERARRLEQISRAQMAAEEAARIRQSISSSRIERGPDIDRSSLVQMLRAQIAAEEGARVRQSISSPRIQRGPDVDRSSLGQMLRAQIAAEEAARIRQSISSSRIQRGPDVDQNALTQMLEMGFAADDAQAALHAFNNDLEQATDALLLGTLPPEGRTEEMSRVLQSIPSSRPQRVTEESPAARGGSRERERETAREQELASERTRRLEQVSRAQRAAEEISRETQSIPEREEERAERAERVLDQQSARDTTDSDNECVVCLFQVEALQTNQTNQN